MLPWRQSGPSGPTKVFDPGQSLGDGIVVRDVLSVSGGGVLYHGQDTRLNRDVAIRSSNDLSVLLNQAQAMQSAPQEVSTAVYRIGQHAGIPFIIGERIVANSLNSLIASRKRTVDVLEIMSRVCFALAAVHEARFAIGDLTTRTTLVDDERIIFSQFALGQGEYPDSLSKIPKERRREGVHIRNRDIYAMARMTCQLLLNDESVPRTAVSLRDALSKVPDVPAPLVDLLCEILDLQTLTNFDAQALLGQFRTIRQRILLQQEAIRVWIASEPGPIAQRIENQVLRTDRHIDVSVKSDLTYIEKYAAGAKLDVIFVSHEFAEQPIEACINLQKAAPETKIVYVGGRPGPDDIALLYQLGVHRVIPQGPGVLLAIWEVLYECRRRLGKVSRRMVVNG